MSGSAPRSVLQFVLRLVAAVAAAFCVAAFCAIGSAASAGPIVDPRIKTPSAPTAAEPALQTPRPQDQDDAAETDALEERASPCAHDMAGDWRAYETWNADELVYSFSADGRFVSSDWDEGRGRGSWRCEGRKVTMAWPHYADAVYYGRFSTFGAARVEGDAFFADGARMGGFVLWRLRKSDGESERRGSDVLRPAFSDAEPENGAKAVTL